MFIMNEENTIVQLYTNSLGSVYDILMENMTRTFLDSEKVHVNYSAKTRTMTEALTTFGERTEKLDVDRVVVISTLPKQLQYEPREQFNETIFRLICLKFDLESGVIDRIIRFPLVDDVVDQVTHFLLTTNKMHEKAESSRYFYKYDLIPYLMYIMSDNKGYMVL